MNPTFVQIGNYYINLGLVTWAEYAHEIKPTPVANVSDRSGVFAARRAMVAREAEFTIHTPSGPKTFMGEDAERVREAIRRHLSPADVAV